MIYDLNELAEWFATATPSKWQPYWIGKQLLARKEAERPSMRDSGLVLMRLREMYNDGLVTFCQRRLSYGQDSEFEYLVAKKAAQAYPKTAFCKGGMEHVHLFTGAQLNFYPAAAVA